jgi:hypothetical protein
MHIILATREEETRKIVVQILPRYIVCDTLSQKTLHNNRAGGVAEGEGPEFRPQYLNTHQHAHRYIPARTDHTHTHTHTHLGYDSSG